jgi:hypothetical protein
MKKEKCNCGGGIKNTVGHTESCPAYAKAKAQMGKSKLPKSCTCGGGIRNGVGHTESCPAYTAATKQKQSKGGKVYRDVRSA